MKLQALGPISITRYAMNMSRIDLLEFLTEYFETDEDGYVNLYGHLTIEIIPLETSCTVDGAQITKEADHETL